jgi:AmpE protein
MAIKLLAILLVLFVCHTLPDLARWRDFAWWRSWLEQLGRPPAAAAALVLGIIAPVLVCALVQWGLRLPWFGLLEFLFAAVVLYYCWGPLDLERDVEAIDKAPDAAQRLAAAQALKTDEKGELPFDAEHLVTATFHAGLKRWFGVLFWFAVLGPCGALLYRLSQLLAGTAELGNRPLAQKFAAVLDWAPAHLMALSLALASNFDAVFTSWRDYHRAHPQGYASLDLGFLDAIARASVDADVAAGEGEVDAHSPLIALDDAMVLVRRVLVVWLTLIALLVIGGFF